ncbi:dinb protein [hydrocarbon metagenome]|uniref:Dinb protein n=1 Tax=hydrocarbon metagenome TaxID=938273 RepID=A0A0W8G2N0_9ZZZZ
MQHLFITLAGYNAWANALLFEHLSELSPEDFAAPRPVNFGSLAGIANHVLLADRAWLARFTGSGDSPTAIDTIPYPGCADLLAARRAEDARIVDFAQELDPARLTGILHYQAMDGRPMALPMAAMVAHFFNHQTHHRGQMHALCGECGIRPRDIDLVFYQRQVSEMEGKKEG